MEESCHVLKQQQQSQSQSPPVRDEVVEMSQGAVDAGGEREGSPLDLSRHSPTQPHTPPSGWSVSIEYFDCMTSWVVLGYVTWGRTPWAVPWAAGLSYSKG